MFFEVEDFDAAAPSPGSAKAHDEDLLYLAFPSGIPSRAREDVAREHTWLPATPMTLTWPPLPLARGGLLARQLTMVFIFAGGQLYGEHARED